MALFGKKDKKKENASGKGNAKEKKSKVSMNRKGKGHALTISVPEAATELLQDNTPFIINGKTVGAAVSISEAIGDLKNKKDADVGQIVNYINHGTIEAVVLEPLLADDTIIIIPSSSSMDTMRAYDSFKDTQYELCYVDLTEGSIEPCIEEETKFSFSELEMVSNGRKDLASLLGISAPAATASSAYDEDEDDEDDLFYGNPDEMQFGNDDFDNDEFTGNAPYDDEFDMPESPTDLEEPYVPEEYSVPLSEPYPATEYVEEDPFASTTDETIAEIALRTFMVDDIQIEVSDEPFQMQFNYADLVLFTENRPTNEGDGIANHLNECLNNMSKVANAEIRQLRTNHVNSLHAEYVNSLGEFVKTCINAELSTFGDTMSARDRAKIEEHRQNLLNHLEDEVSERKANIDREYQEAIINARNLAAEAAEHEYRENHQKQYIAQIDAIRNIVEQEIENTYINDISKQNELRHNRAIEMLDDAIITILEQLTIRYADMVRDEQVVYQKHMESMLEFMSHQRYNEMNRIRVLQDEHARVDIAEKMSAKHAADVANITARFNAQKKALEADIESMRKNIDIAVNRATEDAERTIANLRRENQKLVETADRAQERVETADERAESKYKHEIESLHNQIARWEDESEKLHNGQKTSVFVMLGMSVAAVIAAAAIGFISGQSHQAKEYTNNMQMGVQYNQQQEVQNNNNNNKNNVVTEQNNKDKKENDYDNQESNESDAEFSNGIE